MSKLALFMPLTKVDLEQRLVTGVVTAEAPDRAGEICDYESTKPFFAAWSQDASDATGGKSLGAVRAMHNRVAAGKLTDIAFDDEGKRIIVAAKIVDDDEWQKVMEGVYTGFSQGGRYVKRWKDDETGLTRYTADPTEISLVDLPCLPGATFDVVKGETIETRGFAGATAPETAPAADEAVAKGDVKIAAIPPSVESAPAIQISPVEASAPNAPLNDAALAKAQAKLTRVQAKVDKAKAKKAKMRKALKALTPALDALAARVAALEAQPAPAKAALRAIARTHDEGGSGGASIDDAVKRLAALPAQERAHALMKLSLANPAPARL